MVTSASLNSSHFGKRGTCDLMVIGIGNGYSDLISNPGQSCLHFR